MVRKFSQQASDQTESKRHQRKQCSGAARLRKSIHEHILERQATDGRQSPWGTLAGGRGWSYSAGV